MAKYVCDFAQVKATGEKMCNTAVTMQTSVTTFASSIESDLSTWSGAAKENFYNQCSSQVEIANQNANKIKSAGEYIKKVAEAIEQLDNELATQRI